MKKPQYWLFALLSLSCLPAPAALKVTPGGREAAGDFHFRALAGSWDEAVPLGNGMLGALVWQKERSLRFSLDRADLWDLRPVREFDRPEFRFSWVREQVAKKDYKVVQDLFDLPYERDAGPTKIPAGALEFNTASLGDVLSVDLRLTCPVCRVRWKKGTVLTVFIHATRPSGYFMFKNLPPGVTPSVVPPPYGRLDTGTVQSNSVEGNDLRRLGYPPGVLSPSDSLIRFHQEGWNNFSYDILLRWSRPDRRTLIGSWMIVTNSSPGEEVPRPSPRAYREALASHREWWENFWKCSSVKLPDPILTRQWYRELYKFGASSRRGAPPITLQAVWTADNGHVPPWKGDFHNDLNTQLSYWPCYSSNHLEEGLSFLDWLWATKSTAEAYTKKYFGTDGLDYPGVATLDGSPMGGWIQYSLSPTVSAWLAHHFYLHWRYSMDEVFLRERAYPWVRAVAVHLDQISERRPDGRRRLPLSSSPEINDNDITAWFTETTNFDLALIRWLFSAAAGMAEVLGKPDEAVRWRTILSEWPDLARSEDDGRLLVAPGVGLTASHRHFSHLMAIHPLGLVDVSNGEADHRTIVSSLRELDRLSSDAWCGYSYSWLGSMWARAGEGERAAEALSTFATCFCLPNSFHVNGDQSGTGKSRFTYRPFTLEGNFAFAAAIQEMLLQSHTGVIRIFPAVPASWKNIAFSTLRAEGAFLVSAEKISGNIRLIRVYSEKGGHLRLANPFRAGQKVVQVGLPEGVKLRPGELIDIETAPGMEFEVRAE